MNRRKFLLAGGSLLAAQAAPSDQISLGVIGSGARLLDVVDGHTYWH